jgi:hypothetical protein
MHESLWLEYREGYFVNFGNFFDLDGQTCMNAWHIKLKASSKDKCVALVTRLSLLNVVFFRLSLLTLNMLNELATNREGVEVADLLLNTRPEIYKLPKHRRFLATPLVEGAVEAFCVISCNSDVLGRSVPEIVGSEGCSELLPFSCIGVEVETNN